ncbi:MAG TPA: type II toxin-antitoxin system VapC family toxin [Aestuariivirga sp.]|jgi:PIN domain nuclease of toxin-antitoxin system|nr:type II toxin-antitoxin system VapC family toxin [Aestuariivirga sp.]
MILLDTHFVIELIDVRLGGHGEPHPHSALMNLQQVFVSVTSLWEVAIKFRLGKLPLRTSVEEWPQLFATAEIQLLAIDAKHVFADIGPEIRTNDPFDRLLLGVCAAEGMKLLTVDRELVNHPLAWRS